jgi:Holliday junction DNA helicase RuvA
MIGQLVGTIAYRAERHIILEVGGVGYKVFVSSETQLALGAITPEPVRLWTYLAVREGALDLYGFLEKSELDFFELLLSVSGIGPKSALAILSLAPPATLEKAIVAGDSSYLTKVSGIGRKSAEKIIVELRERLVHWRAPRVPRPSRANRKRSRPWWPWATICATPERHCIKLTTSSPILVTK